MCVDRLEFVYTTVDYDSNDSLSELYGLHNDKCNSPSLCCFYCCKNESCVLRLTTSLPARFFHYSDLNINYIFSKITVFLRCFVFRRRNIFSRAQQNGNVVVMNSSISYPFVLNLLNDHCSLFAINVPPTRQRQYQNDDSICI